MESQITIKELSKITGFAISTISKSLNNSDEISDETKLKIKKTAKKLNYIPNNLARALRNRRTNIIAVIVPKINSAIFSETLSRVHDKALKKGYRILILESFFCQEGEQKCIDTIRDGCIDGIIVIRTVEENTSFFSSNSNTTDMSEIPIVVQSLEQFDDSFNNLRSNVESAFDQLLIKIG